MTLLSSVRTIKNLLKMSSASTTRASGGQSSAVVLGTAGNTVSAPMKVADYLINYATFLDRRRFGEIDDGHGYLDLFDAGSEERLTSDVAWVKRWKYCGRRVWKHCGLLGSILKFHFLGAARRGITRES